MEKKLYHLSYLSTKVENLGADDITEIISRAKAKNKELKITGVLIDYLNYFVQYIEGEKLVIQKLFQKIEQDHRHQNVIVINEGELENRLFPQWEMQQKIIDENAYEQVSLDEIRILLADPKSISNEFFVKVMV